MCGASGCAADGACHRSRGLAPGVRPPALFAVLQEHLPLVDGAVAMTGNGTALLSETGAYARPTAIDDAYAWEPGRINLRLAPGLVRSVRSSPAVTAEHQPATIGLYDDDARMMHKSYLLSDADHAVVTALALAARSLEDDEASRTDGGRTSPGRAEGIAGFDHLQHLDAIAHAGGLGREALLNAAPDTIARPVDPDVLPALLGHLCHLSLPVTIGIATTGCLQLHRGSIDAVEPSFGALAVVSDSATLALDPSLVGSSWVVTSSGVHGATSTVEVYDTAGRNMAIVTQTGLVDPGLIDDWQAITASLPA